MAHVERWRSKFGLGNTKEARRPLTLTGFRHCRVLAYALLFTVAGVTTAKADCAPDHVHLRWQGGQIQFATEVADTEAERSRGLMHRSELGRYEAMLFAYKAPKPVAFWMKNTLIPLDMLFLDERGVVTKIHSNATPLDLTSIFGGDSVQYVLEINGGLAQKLGIAVGAELRHPVLGSSIASWTCENSE